MLENIQTSRGVLPEKLRCPQRHIREFSRHNKYKYMSARGPIASGRNFQHSNWSWLTLDCYVPFRKQRSCNLYQAIASVHSRSQTAICLQTSVKCAKLESEPYFPSISTCEMCDRTRCEDVKLIYSL